jgi:hypothetical protein
LGLEAPAAAAFALLVLFFLLRRTNQTRRPARRARTARPPTAAPAMTPTLDFLAGVAAAGAVVADEGGEFGVVGVVGVADELAGVVAILRLDLFEKPLQFLKMQNNLRDVVGEALVVALTYTDPALEISQPTQEIVFWSERSFTTQSTIQAGASELVLRCVSARPLHG